MICYVIFRKNEPKNCPTVSKGEKRIQIFLNYLTVFIIPAVIGLVCRLIFWKADKGWIVTTVFAGLALVMLIANFIVDSHGNEKLGLLTIPAATAAAVSLIRGIIIRALRKGEKKK